MVMQWENNKFEQISRDARQHWFCHLANYCTACNKIKLRLEGVSKIEGSLNLGSLYAGFPDLTLVISAQFTFEMSLCARHSQKLQKKLKTLILEVQGHLRSLMLTPLRIASLVFIVISSCFHATRANIGKITTFARYPFLHPRAQAFLKLGGRDLDC